MGACLGPKCFNPPRHHHTAVPSLATFLVPGYGRVVLGGTEAFWGETGFEGGGASRAAPSAMVVPPLELVVSSAQGYGRSSLGACRTLTTLPKRFGLRVTLRRPQEALEKQKPPPTSQHHGDQ